VIQEIIWTSHALQRLQDRGLLAREVEDTLREGHRSREVNRGEADWRVYGARVDGKQFVVVYDHPALGSRAAARVVSVWVLRK
jgi:hypothetical protein